MLLEPDYSIVLVLAVLVRNRGGVLPAVASVGGGVACREGGDARRDDAFGAVFGHGVQPALSGECVAAVDAGVAAVSAALLSVDSM